MKELILNIYNKVGIKSDRTKNIAKHIGWSFLFKAGSVIANFLLVPLTIDYLDTENYGVWLTLTSFISWFALFDIGLGNGLKNKFAEAKVSGQVREAQIYVSTAYFTIGIISIILIAVFLILNYFIDWTVVFNTSKSLRSDLSILLPIIFGFFALQLVLKLITSIYQADQNHSIQNKIQFFIQTISLILIYFLINSNRSSLLTFGTFFSAVPLIILFLVNIFAFRNKYNSFKPKLHLWEADYFKQITGLSMRFFIVQISAMILFSTDNFLISKIFSPEEVVPYGLAYKYFSITSIGFSIIITPYWSSFTEAFSKKDYEWIKNSMSYLLKFSVLFSFIGLFLFLTSNLFFEIWINKKVQIEIGLRLLILLYFILSLFLSPFTCFINGVGKIKIQYFSSIITALLNIPISIFLAHLLGLEGIILGTIICLIPSYILGPIQYFKIMGGNTHGIWNE